MPKLLNIFCLGHCLPITWFPCLQLINPLSSSSVFALFAPSAAQFRYESVLSTSHVDGIADIPCIVHDIVLMQRHCSSCLSSFDCSFSKVYNFRTKNFLFFTQTSLPLLRAEGDNNLHLQGHCSWNPSWTLPRRICIVRIWNQTDLWPLRSFLSYFHFSFDIFFLHSYFKSSSVTLIPASKFQSPSAPRLPNSGTCKAQLHSPVFMD